MKVIVSMDHDPYSIDPSRVEGICVYALKMSGAPESSEISVSFIDDNEMAELNSRYRGKDGPTDVLSFECDNLDDGFPKDEGRNEHLLGDIVIAPDVAKRQSVEYGNDLEAEIDLLCVHGVLHLQGYDHVQDEDAEEMEGLQSEILCKWKDEVSAYA